MTIQKKEPAKVISFINMKGGVGKTTLCKEVGYHLSQIDGKKVLLIDIDPQANLTQSFFRKYKFMQKGGIKTEDTEDFTFTDQSVNFLFNPSLSKRPVDETAILVLDDNLSIIPGTLGADFLSRKINSADMEHSIFNFLYYSESNIRADYDFILLDCPPTYSEYTVAAILASQYYIIPVHPDSYSILGINMLEDVIQDIKKNNPIYFKDKPLKNIGVIFTKIPNTITVGQEQVMSAIKGSEKLQGLGIDFFESNLLYNPELFKKLDYFIDAYDSDRSKENLQAIIKEFEGRL